MSTDRLRTEPNERVDIRDFQFLAGDAIAVNFQQVLGECLVSPAKTRQFVLDGFAMSNPSAKQLQVTRGRALLAQRANGTVQYGILATKGNLTQIVDLNPYASGTYGIYVRFEEVPSANEGRIFWDETVGTEYSQSIYTRYSPNWSVRVEASNPGAEWMKIGTVVQSTMAIVDFREFYFEGKTNLTYLSGWSADGGGVANDRNANRALYGVSDFQTFSGAMRQCLEDIKGRGLRRWWDRDIGGLNVGFDASPVEDRVAVGDVNFSMLLAAGMASLAFSSSESIVCTRTNADLMFKTGSANQAHLDDAGMWITHGLNVGFVDDGVDDRVAVGDVNFSMKLDTDAYLYWDDTDYLKFSRSGDTLSLYVGGAQRVFMSDTQVWVGDADFGLTFGPNPNVLKFASDTGISFNRGSNHWLFTLGGTGMIDITPTGVEMTQPLYIEDLNFGLYLASGTDPTISFATHDIFTLTRSTHKLSLELNSVNQFSFEPGGLQLAGGLNVGFSGTLVDDRIQLYDADCYWYCTASTFGFQFSSMDYEIVNRSTHIMTWHLSGGDVVNMSAFKIYPTLDDNVGLGDVTHRFKDCFFERAWLSRATNPQLTLDDAGASTDHRYFQIFGESSSDKVFLRFTSDAGTAGNIFEFQRRISGNLYECLEVLVYGDSFLPGAASFGTTYLGNADQAWFSLYSRGARLEEGYDIGGISNWVSYTGKALPVGSTGPSTPSGYLPAGLGSWTIAGWLKLYVGTGVNYIMLLGDTIT